MSYLEILLSVYIVQLWFSINQLRIGYSNIYWFYFSFVPVIWLIWYGYVFFYALISALWLSAFDFKNQKSKMDGEKVPVDLEAKDRPAKRRYRKVYGKNEREE